METLTQKIKALIAPSFQIITLGILIFLVVIVLKQQKDISDLKSQVYDTESSINSKIQSVESSLSSDIERVRRAVIIWSD